MTPLAKDIITSSTRMPALFLGHGSPMDVLEDNLYARSWQKLRMTLPRPQAIMAVSAHWLTRGTRVTTMETSLTIHDFGGFPQVLYDTHYPVPGSSMPTQHLVKLLAPVPVTLDKKAWGSDHGPWGVLIKTYPDTGIPMVQSSIDSSKPVVWHFEVRRGPAALRDGGIMLVASDNVMHNLRTVRWHDDSSPYPWVMSFNGCMEVNLAWQGAVEQHPLVNYLDREGGALSNPAPEHYLSLLYVSGT